jgi:predicted alpha/beta superfamily hydrolase
MGQTIDEPGVSTTRTRRSSARTPFHRELRVHYPPGSGRVVLRTDIDWDKDVEPASVSSDGATSTFVLESRHPFLYFKPCVVPCDGGLIWSVGSNTLVLMTVEEAGDVYPCFTGPERGTFAPLAELNSAVLGRRHRLRIYLPAGYAENTLRSYPVFYMQDGKNLFFPEEAFQGKDWHVAESLDLLDAMCAVDRAIVVGIDCGDRMSEYTLPGYEAYARSVVEEVRPELSRRFRILDSPAETGVMGSSLGGVVSFYMAYQHPQVFGYAACMSSPFTHRDDLIDRVRSEPKCPAKFYLDSGWPGDNYEVTLAMAMALFERGYRVPEDFLHLAFPLDVHDERSWGKRLHVPVQLAFGKPGMARRGRFV